MTQGINGGVPLIGILTSQAASGTKFASYTTAKTVINAASVITLPPNFLYAGHVLRINALLGISNVVTAQPTFTFQIMVGAVIAWTSGAVLTSTTAHTDIPTDLTILLRVASVGAGTSGTLLGHGRIAGRPWIASGATADFAQGFGGLVLPITAPAAGTGYDSTVSNTLDFFVGLSASDAGNAVQVFNYVIEDLN